MWKTSPALMQSSFGDRGTYVKLARMYVASARGSCSRVSDTSEGREGGREAGGKTGERGRQQGPGRQKKEC